MDRCGLINIDERGKVCQVNSETRNTFATAANFQQRADDCAEASSGTFRGAETYSGVKEERLLQLLRCTRAAVKEHHPPTNTRVNAPPVVVELPVTEAQQLGREVHGRVKEPVEEHQPQQVVGDLKAQAERR